MSKEVFSKKVKSIFLGKKVRKYWEVWYGYKPELSVKTETLERVKILEKEMDFEFKEGEEIYLDEQGKYATIEKRARDTNGNIIYNVTYVTEIIEDFDPNIKEQYEKECIEEEIKREKQELERNKIKEEYEKFCRHKEDVPKKGLIIQKLPVDSSPAQLKSSQMGMNKKFLDYDVITTIKNVDIDVFHYDENGRIVDIKTIQ